MVKIVQIIEITEGKLLNKQLYEAEIEHLFLDSRKILVAEKSLFFAFEGMQHDAHIFIDELYEKGVRNFIVLKEINTQKYPKANFIQVLDAYLALQQLATSHRRQFSIPVIGITGSNGKTIVKEWLYDLLRKEYNIIRSPKSYNSQIGVPLSIWQMQAIHDLAIFEAGISKPGEMIQLAPIIDCSIGIFTNIGNAHSEGFHSIQEKVKEKLCLFKNTKTIIYCKDHEIIDAEIQNLNKECFSWSKELTDVNLRIISIQKGRKNSTDIQGIFHNEKIEINIPFIDEASIENAIHCWSLMLLLAYSPSIIRQRMQYLEPIAMRLELKAGINNCRIINDSYNSDLNALTIALDFVNQQSNQANRTLILSDILQSGQAPQVLYQAVGDLIIKKNITYLIGIGNEINVLKKILPADFNARFFPDTTSFLDQFQADLFSNELILLKGARRFAFEKIANRLVLKAHKTILEINLNALIYNLRVYLKYLRPTTKIMIMVKASAYGSGSHEVARLLEFQKVDYLAVAYADEGIELRKAGIQLPVLVLNPDESSFDTLLRYNLEPEIYSLGLLKKLLKYTNGSKTAIHIKLDTGMHRLGLEDKDIPELVNILIQNPNIRIQSIFSHLAASNNPVHDDFTRQQITKFQHIYKIICKNLDYKPLRHILNSCGIYRFPQHQMDMVRLGSGVYGIDSGRLLQDQLAIVSTLKATISQIKTVAAEETIGYDRNGKATQNMRIATVSIGYADGLRRSAGNGNYDLFVDNQAAPIIGNVCMDMCMIDITTIPDAKVGDEVIVFGKKPLVQTLAKSFNTIPYEVFTGISGRVKRIYFQE